MKTIKITEQIHVFGTTFKDIYEIAHYCRNEIPKDGVYVDQFVKHHLWFDECDYLSDNYWFRSFVFAKSKDEVENKLEKLRESQFPEFREELAPMIYWDDKYDDMEVTDDVTSSLHNFTILRNLSTLSFTPILKSLRRLWHYGTRF